MEAYSTASSPTCPGKTLTFFFDWCLKDYAWIENGKTLSNSPLFWWKDRFYRYKVAVHHLKGHQNKGSSHGSWARRPPHGSNSRVEAYSITGSYKSHVCLKLALIPWGKESESSIVKEQSDKDEETHQYILLYTDHESSLSFELII